MSAKEKILEYLEKNQVASGRELTELLGITRQAINKHLKELVQHGKIAKEGATKGAVYKLPGKTNQEKSIRKFAKTYSLPNIEEDRVFQEAALLLNLEHELSGQTLDIGRYAFTEILNNAIEHSSSNKCSVEVILNPYHFQFRIRDFGIGVFHSIFEKFKLSGENAAVGELIKGKTTTMADRHTGEGIFFTSKASDRFILRSHKINLIFDNIVRDAFVEEKRYITGSDVFFSISKRSKKRLDKIFQAYVPEEFDYRFDRTRVQVKFFQKQYVSRSEAKRLLHRLDQFTEIILDFEGVKSIGQGFADEVFRVFREIHPDIVIKTEHVSPVLEPMIRHSVDKNILEN